MNLMQKRPLATGCAIYLLSAWAFLSFGGEWRGFLALLLLWGAVVSLVLSLILKKSKVICLAIFLPAALGAGLSFLAADFPLLQVSEFVSDGQVHRVEVRCEEVGYQADYAAEYRVRLLKAEGKETIGTAILVCEHEMDMRKGDVISISVLIKPSGYTTHRFSEEYGACMILLSEEQDSEFIKIVSEPFFERWARRFKTRLSSNLSEESAGLISALLLGDRSGLPYDITSVFRNLGVSHVLAVSGLHLTLVLFGLEWMLKKMTVPRGIRDLCALLGTVGYILLTGAGSSVLRAGSMLLLTRLSLRAERENDSVTTLLAAVTLIVTASPFAVLDIGLQLSALATAGILFVTGANRIAEGKTGKAIAALKSVTAAVSISLGALVATLPLSVYYFGTVSLMTLPSNLLFSLPVSVCMMGGIAFLFLGELPILSGCLAWVADLGAKFLLAFSRFLDGGRNYLIAPSQTAVLLSLLVAGVLAVLLCLRLGKHKTLTRVLPMVLAVLFVWGGFGVERMLRQDLRITFLSDGRNDGMVVSEGNTTLMIDCSDGSYAPSIAETATAVRVHFSAAPAGYLLTHYHQRSLSAVRRVLGQGSVKTLYLPHPQTESEITLANRMEAIAEQIKTEVRYYAADGLEELKFGDAAVRVWKQSIKRSSHPTLRIEIVCHGQKIGYLGASAHESEREEVGAWISDLDTAFLGSHGPIIKTPLDGCGSAVCASEKIERELGVTDAIILESFENRYTVSVKKQTEEK
jgi:competence protein ComEC